MELEIYQFNFFTYYSQDLIFFTLYSWNPLWFFLSEKSLDFTHNAYFTVIDFFVIKLKLIFL